MVTNVHRAIEVYYTDRYKWSPIIASGAEGRSPNARFDNLYMKSYFIVLVEKPDRHYQTAHLC